LLLHPISFFPHHQSKGLSKAFTTLKDKLQGLYEGVVKEKDYRKSIASPINA